MAKSIIWTPQAEKTFENILQYLENNWSEKELERFVFHTNKIIQSIAVHPEMYRRSGKANIHEALITKHNLLIYCNRKNRVDLISFWDTRQHPRKKKKLIR